MLRDEEALEYHEGKRPGKVEVVSTKPCATQRDLSLAYTPGVAVPCLHIEKNPEDAYRYTSKGNLVAVLSNGTAVLGLGDIGAIAGKPVMEGKGVLFKQFADVDVFDIEVNTHDPDEVIKVAQLLEPTFGGINLEDIKAPECFYIEETLKKTMGIPVFHDDQHGTAIISGAALLNALLVTGKKIDQVKVVFNGAGASGIACAKFYLSLGVKLENLILCDTKGVVYKGRTAGMNPWKEPFAAQTDRRTLEDAMRGADVFVGCSVKDTVTPAMVKTMAERPIIFAMANPDPEITPEAAFSARKDVIMATGRSDYPNQVNNVLGFPFIFRGALDCRATTINEEMKSAAAHALAELARQDVPDSVCKAYGVDRLHFGPEYLIPKPFDYRVLLWEAAAVAKAAMDTGVARVPLNLDEYKERLEARLGRGRQVTRFMMNRARSATPKRIVFPEGANSRVLRACQTIVDEKIAEPLLIGNDAQIHVRATELGLHIDEVKVIDPAGSPHFESYVAELHRIRQRKGVTLDEARRLMKDPTVFACMMVRMGHADSLVAGIDQHYPETIRPALQIIGMRPGVKKVAGLFAMMLKERMLFFADTTVNIDPTAEELADIAISSAEVARRFDVEPRVAMISFSNFGSSRHPFVEKVQKATELVRQRAPNLVVDGEIQADAAIVPEILAEHFPFSSLAGGANVLIFPNLESANVAYKLVHRLAGAEIIGPILMGMKKPVHVLAHGMEVKDIVNIAAIAAVDAQELAGQTRRPSDAELLARAS